MFSSEPKRKHSQLPGDDGSAGVGVGGVGGNVVEFVLRLCTACSVSPEGPG